MPAVYEIPPAEDATESLAVCLDCLAQRCKSQADARYVLGKYAELACQGVPPLDAWVRAVPQFWSIHDNGRHETRVAQMSVTMGRVADPRIQALLGQSLRPQEFESGHFEFRPPLRGDIEGEAKRVGVDTAEILPPRKYRFYQGPRKLRGEDVPPERLVSLMFRVPTKWYCPEIRSGRQLVVAIESGLPVLEALIAKASRERDRLYHEACEAKGIGKEAVPGRLAWYLFDRYIDLTGEEDVLAAISSAWPDRAPDLVTAVDALGLAPERRSLIVGDVFVMAFLVDKRSVFIADVRNIGQIFDILEARGYPRLAVTSNRQPYRAILKICKDIAAPLERARVGMIDWAPILEGVGQLWSSTPG